MSLERIGLCLNIKKKSILLEKQSNFFSGVLAVLVEKEPLIHLLLLNKDGKTIVHAKIIEDFCSACYLTSTAYVFFYLFNRHAGDVVKVQTWKFFIIQDLI